MGYRVTTLVYLVTLLALASLPSYAQQSAPAQPPVAPATRTQISDSAPVATPQVSPIVHRLNGLMILNLLRRNGMKVAPLSNDLLTADALQTSITAGLTLGDGSIVARLPRAELELTSTAPTAAVAPATGGNAFDTPPNLFVLQRDGTEQSLRFLGVDGGTGLSLLRVDGPAVGAAALDANEEFLRLGQRIRVMFPERAPQAEGLGSGLLFVHIAGIEANLLRISRAPSGKVTRLTIKAENLSPANVGGVAVNDAGETIGVIEAINGNEAHVIPVAGVRQAIERIRLGLESKPQPWLGVRGIWVAEMTREQLVNAGWKRSEALSLLARQVGVVLTSVPPKTPAFLASLRVGDVVTRVNGGEVRSAADFSYLLTQASGKPAVRFTVIGPSRAYPRNVFVKLDVSLNPVREMEAAEQRAARLNSSDPFVARGLETLPMTTELATRLKARGGLFVVFVHPSSAASRGGIVAGDVIEAIDSNLLSENTLPTSLPDRVTLDVIRNGEKLALQIETETSPSPTPQP